MRKKLGIISVIISILTLIYLMTAGCSFFSPIVGKWQDTSSQDTIEFTSGGDVIIKTSRSTVVGTYDLVGSDVIKANFEGIRGELLSAFGGDAWEYEISGDTLTIKSFGKTTKYKRVN